MHSRESCYSGAVNELKRPVPFGAAANRIRKRLLDPTTFDRAVAMSAILSQVTCQKDARIEFTRELKAKLLQIE